MQEITLDPEQRWDNTASQFSQKFSPIETIAQACQKVGPVTGILIPRALWSVLLVHHAAGGNRRGPFTPEILAGLLALRGAGPVNPHAVGVGGELFNAIEVRGERGELRITGVLGVPCASAAPPSAPPPATP